MMNPRHRTAAGRGFTLVEILIAMLLGLGVVAAMFQFYQGNKQTYRITGVQSELNEGGRFAKEFLARDLRMAGYLSCGGAGATVGNTVNSGAGWLYELGGLEGFEGGVDAPPADFAARVRAGTDSLIVRHSAAEDYQRVALDDAENAVVQFTRPHNFRPGEVLVLSDAACTQATLFQATDAFKVDGEGAPSAEFDAIRHSEGAESPPGNCTAALRGEFSCSDLAGANAAAYDSGAQVTRYQAHAYYVSADAAAPALIRKRLVVVNGAARVQEETLLENVESMQILYGVDPQDDGIDRVESYVRADQVASWDNVRSVRLALLLRSTETEAVSQEGRGATFDLLGTAIDPPDDGRLRRVFTTTVALRNRVP